VPTIDEIANAIRKYGLEKSRIGIDITLMDAQKYAALLKLFPDAEFTDISSDFTALRRVKSPGEISLSRESARSCDEVWANMRGFIKPGMYDYEITAEWGRMMYLNQADKHFNLTTIHPYDVSSPMHPAYHSPVRVENDSVIGMEITNSIGGYWSQRLGNAYMGEPKPIMMDLFAALKEAHIKASELIKPGVCAADIAEKMDSVVRSKGFLCTTDFASPPQGHLMGLTLDEGTVSPDAKFVLEEGMVLVIHPSAAVEGFKLGEPAMAGPGTMYLVTKEGNEKLFAHELEFMAII
jgi:Xaa-Pro aminopeptidase